VPNTRPLPLWAGRTLALVGILLVALNLRTAVAAISPIIDHIDADIPLTAIGLGIIGTVPAIAFALSAIFGAQTAKKLGLEQLLLLSIAVMTIGHVLRALADSYFILLLGTILALITSGVANVLLPPLVKRYFPDRVGLMTSLYALLLSVSSALPAAFAAPLADSAGWQFSLGIWSLLSFLSMLPWVGVLVGHRKEKALLAAVDSAPEIAATPAGLAGSVWHSRVAWTLAVVFAMSSGHFYTAAAWLPEMMTDIAGATSLEAGGMLAALSLMGVPTALVIPLLASRMKNVGLLVFVGIGFFVLGYLGLLIAPTSAPWVWAMLIGVGPLVFPLVLLLINLRSRTEAGSVALSGFVQGVGYALAAPIPLVVGVLHDVSGEWAAPLVFLLATSLAATIPALQLRKPIYVEDELAHRKSSGLFE
jgi:CP family cyanate transporter-like MFS transporter